MQVLLIRHAIAEDAQTGAAQDDERRPLTELGRRRMRKGANRLRTVVEHIDVFATSPLQRARETAEILTRAYGAAPPVEQPALAPGGAAPAVQSWLGTLPADGVVALVGHEPDLGQLAGWFLCGSPRRLVEFKKGGAALLAFEGPPQVGTAILRWALTAGQLRSLKD